MAVEGDAFSEMSRVGCAETGGGLLALQEGLVGFEILGRPVNEKPYLLIPAGFPAEGCRVPDLEKKSMGEVMVRD